MPEREKSAARERAESWFFWWRIAVTVCGALAVLWVQFLGQGVKTWAQDFTGLTAMRVEVSGRLDYIERVLPAPRVVEWVPEASRQLGECTVDHCGYRLVAHRTEFGETCGKPEHIEVFIRLPTSRELQISYANFEAIELGRVPQEFDVALALPRLLPAGSYYWRSKTTYPSCAGPREPIPRYSPWWPLEVTEGG